MIVKGSFSGRFDERSVRFDDKGVVYLVANEIICSYKERSIWKKHSMENADVSMVILICKCIMKGFLMKERCSNLLVMVLAVVFAFCIPAGKAVADDHSDNVMTYAFCPFSNCLVRLLDLREYSCLIQCWVRQVD